MYINVNIISILNIKMDGPARKVRKSLVLDPWDKDGLNVQLFQEQLNNAQVSQSDNTSEA